MKNARFQNDLSGECRFLVLFLITLTAIFVMFVVGSALSYIALGIASLGYNASAGGMMSFVLSVASVSSEAVATLLALVTLLYRAPLGREHAYRTMKSIAHGKSRVGLGTQ